MLSMYEDFHNQTKYHTFDITGSLLFILFLFCLPWGDAVFFLVKKEIIITLVFFK